MAVTEHIIQKECVAWLRKHGYFTINTDVMVGLQSKRFQGERYAFINKYKALGYTTGQPDLVVCGRKTPFVFVEFKSKTGQVSFQQNNFREYCQQDLHLPYLIIRSLDELIGQLAILETRQRNKHGWQFMGGQ